MTPPGQIATLILPADAAWDEAPATIARSERLPAWRPGEARIREAADAIRSGMQSGTRHRHAAVRQGAARQGAR